MRILIVEDEKQVARFIEKGFRECSYTTTWAKNCEEANNCISEGEYDLIILDLGLPDGDGLDLLRNWRNYGFNEPVLILSARDSLDDRVKGLNIGADDYLPKPFSFVELLARARSQMRRSSQVRQSAFDHRGIHMDLLGHTVTYKGKSIDLTNREFSLMEILLQNKGRVLTRTQIGEKIWEAHYDMQTNLIDVYIRKLRNLFPEHSDPPLIKTVRGVGYSIQ
jgi:DNA-binding response OmpR family regulator